MYVPLSDVIFTVPLTPSAPSYDRRPPSNIAEYPRCASRTVHDTAHTACRPRAQEVLRGLGLLSLAKANPCWVETLPICRPPVLRTAPRPTTTKAAPKVAAPKPVLAVTTKPPAAAVPVRQAGFTTGGLLAVAAAVGVGGWLLFGRKKKPA